MAQRLRLTSEQRQFFSLVSQAVLSNPFSDKRINIDLQISGLFPETPETERIDRTIAEVRAQIAYLEKNNKEHLDAYSQEDRTILHNAFLFDFFHVFLDRFDQHILDQIQSGTKPLKVDFSQEALRFLRQKGFTEEECLRYFAMSFQLRRAFYFIDRGLVGSSRSMRQLREKLWNNVFTADIDLYNAHLWNRMEDFSTLILGETGTGKGTAAVAIGRSGYIPFDASKKCFIESFTQSFISLNLSQFSEALIESELFGHKKGAFTGAVSDHHGIFHQCSPHGAIFLDEIGEVAPPVQIKLLKVLEERIFSPVGSHQEDRFHGRIIAATNRRLKDLQDYRIFREDFFYRLCSDIIMVPPLRQRIAEDQTEMDALLSHTINKIVGHPSEDLCKIVGETIHQQVGKSYPWPGNVRELGQCVRRILLNRQYRPLSEDVYETTQADALETDMSQWNLDAQTLVKKYCFQLYTRYGTYGEVARCTRLDRRTVKKYISEWQENSG